MYPCFIVLRDRIPISSYMENECFETKIACFCVLFFTSCSLCTLVFYVSEKERRKEEKEFIMNRETRVHGVQD